MHGNIVTIDFRNDTLFAVERDDGVFVAIKPISDALGLKWSGQHDRLNRDPILSEGIRVIRIPSIGGTQETTCLKLELVNGWLFGISENAVRDDETRQKVLAYKRECYAVLFKHFYGRGIEERSDPLKVTATEDARRESIRTRRQLVSEARQSYGSHAARELWAYLNLPSSRQWWCPAPRNYPLPTRLCGAIRLQGRQTPPDIGPLR